MTPTWTRWSLFVTAFGALSAAAAAQPAAEPRRYVEFKIDADYEAQLKKRLEMEKQLGPLKDLVNQVLADPSKMPSDPSGLKGMNLKDEAFQKALKDWLAKDPELRKALGRWTTQKMADKKPPQNLATLQKDLKKLLSDTPKVEVSSGPPPLPEGVKPIEPDQPQAESLTQLAMTQAEKSKLGDWLRDSQAWNRALADIRTSIADPNSPRWQIDGWQERLMQKEGALWKFGAGTLDRIREIPRPNVPVPGLDHIAVPGVSAPALPEFGDSTMPMLGTIATWTLFLGVLAMAAWQLLRWARGQRRATVDARVQLGPWPVRPEAIRTRSELILAFDYLALLTLGPDVRSWNHHAVAARWREQAPALAASAQVLETLYEQARYTEHADSLSDAERDQARRALVQLAEVL